MALLAGALLTGGIAAQAALSPDQGVPRTIPYRGVLEQNSSPVVPGPYTMEFQLFPTEDATVPGWTETQSVNVVDGRFSVQLGAQMEIPPELLDRNALFLAVTVNGQALVGRQQLLTAPYAHRADSAWTFRSRDITTDLVPPGTIVAFGGTTAPAGWLACNGASLSREAYQDLFAAIGTTWGAPDSYRFNVPDLRGRFPRGADDGANVDPGRIAGTYQPFATSTAGITIQNSGWHDHSAVPNGAGMMVYGVRYNDGYGSAGVAADRTIGQPDLNTYWHVDGGLHGHALLGGATETRPVNAAVKYIIKY